MKDKQKLPEEKDRLLRGKRKNKKKELDLNISSNVNIILYSPTGETLMLSNQIETRIYTLNSEIKYETIDVEVLSGSYSEDGKNIYMCTKESKMKSKIR